MPTLPPDIRKRRVGVGLFLTLALLLGIWALEVWNRTTTDQVVRELLLAQPSITKGVTDGGFITLEGSQLEKFGESVRLSRFDRVHMSQAFITAVHENGSGNSRLGTELQLRRDSTQTNTWIVSRRIGILCPSGRETKVREYMWELGRVPPP